VNAGDTFAVQLGCDGTQAMCARGGSRTSGFRGNALKTGCGDGDVMDDAMRDAVVKEALT
jgi:hypothetical protein